MPIHRRRKRQAKPKLEPNDDGSIPQRSLGDEYDVEVTECPEKDTQRLDRRVTDTLRRTSSIVSSRNVIPRAFASRVRDS